MKVNQSMSYTFGSRSFILSKERGQFTGKIMYIISCDGVTIDIEHSRYAAMAAMRYYGNPKISLLPLQTRW